MMSHTPGPWTVVKVSEGSVGWWVGKHMSEEDARLVAAAPELLEALEQIGEQRKFHSVLWETWGTWAQATARAAIAKATGEA